MTPEEIVDALAVQPATAALLQDVAPEVQQNVKDGWLAVIERSLGAIVSPVVLQTVSEPATTDPVVPASPVVQPASESASTDPVVPASPQS